MGFISGEHSLNHVHIYHTSNNETMVNNMRLLCLLPTLLFCAILVGCGDSGTDPDTATDLPPMEGFVELNVKDPLRHSYNFLRATYNGVIQENEIRNAGQHINYSIYAPGAFAVGIQGGEAGTIIDLGPDDSLAAHLGVAQTVGGGQGFSHLQLTGASQTNISDGDQIFTIDPFNESNSHDTATVYLNHVYLLRIQDRYSNLDLIVKLLPVYLEEGTHVHFEWVRLR